MYTTEKLAARSEEDTKKIPGSIISSLPGNHHHLDQFEQTESNSALGLSKLRYTTEMNPHGSNSSPR
jgi:hypothetical protein